MANKVTEIVLLLLLFGLFLVYLIQRNFGASKILTKFLRNFTIFSFKREKKNYTQAVSS